jgi:hypothetical protein
LSICSAHCHTYHFDCYEQNSSQDDRSIDEVHHAARRHRHSHSRPSTRPPDGTRSRTRAPHTSRAEMTLDDPERHRKEVKSGHGSQRKSLQSPSTYPSTSNEVPLQSRGAAAKSIHINEGHTSIAVAHVSPRSNSKQNPLIRLKSDTTGLTIRHVPSTKPSPANGSIQPPQVVIEDEPRTARSFRQPTMDEQGSRSFVFGTQAHEHGPPAATMTRAPSTTVTSGSVAGEVFHYVRGSNGDFHTFHHGDESLQHIPEEELAPTEVTTMATRVDSQASLQKIHTTGGLMAFKDV